MPGPTRQRERTSETETETEEETGCPECESDSLVRSADGGGELVARGTPEAVAREDASHTGRYLRDLLPDVDLKGPRDDRRKPATAADDD